MVFSGIMRSCPFLFLFPLALRLFATAEAADSSIVDSKSLSSAAALQQPAGKSVLLNDEQKKKVGDFLKTKNVSIAELIVAAMISEDTMELALITLGSDGNPHKISYSFGREFFAYLAAQTSITPSEQTENVSSVSDTTQSDTLRVEQSTDQTGASHSAKDQTGRVYFMLHTVLKSTTIYPTALNAAFPNTDGSTIAGVALLTFGGSLYGSYLFTKTLDLGYGRVTMMNHGGEIGTVVPFFISNFLRYSTKISDMTVDKIQAWATMFGFPLGLYAGSKVSCIGNQEYGNARIVVTMSQNGILYGFALPALFYESIDNESFVSTSSVLSLAFMPAGFYLGYKMTENKHFSSGRGLLVTYASGLGALTGLATPVLFDATDKNAYILLLIAGHLAGTTFGFKYREDRPLTLSQGVFTIASSLVGGGVALALPLIAKADEDKAYVLAGMGGTWAGMILGEYLSRSIFEFTRHDRSTSLRMSVPLVYQWPTAVATAIVNRKTNSDTPVQIDFLEIGFN
ncbi:MAG: hypothetical protein JW795_03830 [Chitinivibrionales bacterium]|nr:hypothetical protein [Chitinivibrionales bacterium]